jgi:7-cyano-7-deazaguanine reductase
MGEVGAFRHRRDFGKSPRTLIHLAPFACQRRRFPHAFLLMSDPKILATFPNPAPERDYEIEHTHHEFTSLCPMTGHPDFAEITVFYVPDKICVELKSLKLYFHGFRNEGIFFEAATNKICDDLGRALQPKRLSIVADWKARGGFSSVITADWTPAKKRSRRAS